MARYRSGADATRAVGTAPAGRGVYRFPMAAMPGQTIKEWGWAHDNTTIVRIEVLSITKPTTAGVFRLYVLANNESLLYANYFDLKTLDADTVTTLEMTIQPSRKYLENGDRIEVRLVSDNLDLVAQGLYIQLVHDSTQGESGGGGGGGGEGVFAAARELYDGSEFTFDGTRSVLTLANTVSTDVDFSGVKELYRNGIADMVLVSGAPAADGEWRIVGDQLQIFGDVRLLGTWKVVYPLA